MGRYVKVLCERVCVCMYLSQIVSLELVTNTETSVQEEEKGKEG